MATLVGSWEVGEVRRTSRIPQEYDDGTTDFVRVRIDALTVKYMCADGSEDELRVVVTRHGYNLTWPDGHSEGSRPRAVFYRWLAERFGAELALAVARELEAV